MSSVGRSNGFTIIELAVAGVLLFIVTALIILTASGIQAKNRNGDRLSDIDALRGQLEGYYAATDKYPTLANVNDPAWRAANMPRLTNGALDDPLWRQDSLCTNAGKPTLAAGPTANCYSYQVAASDGSACDNNAKLCVHYTLTTILEGGERYVKSSLN